MIMVTLCSEDLRVFIVISGNQTDSVIQMTYNGCKAVLHKRNLTEQGKLEEVDGVEIMNNYYEH